MAGLLKVGLTGGIGSGKTTVAALFTDCGAPCVDADQVSHAVTQPGQSGYDGIVGLFGTDVIAADGRLDRARLREIVFNNPTLKARLEALIHPLVSTAIENFIAEAVYNYCIISIPLLLETDAMRHVDRVLVVDLPEDLQVLRACKRDEASEASVRNIIKAQTAREQRLMRADDVIHNTRDISFLKQQVETLHEKYLQLGTGPA